MTQSLRLTFDTAESQANLIIRNPRPDVTQDEAKDSMDNILDSGAFEGFTGVVKAVLYESNHTLIYEA